MVRNTPTPGFGPETWERLKRARKSGRLSPVVAVLATGIFDDSVERGESIAMLLLRELKDASSAALRALDRDFRSPAFLTQWPTCSTLNAGQWARCDSLSGDAQLAALAIASMGRAGRFREAACRRLGRRPEPLSFAFLVLRLNDSFASTRGVAREALQRWLTPKRITQVSQYAPLVESASSWQWASGARVVPAFFELLDENEDVLLAQTRHGDSFVRLSAYRRLAHVRAGTAEVEEVLGAALTDASARVRGWARNTTHSPSTPDDVQLRLARVMWESPSPRTRELALKILRTAEDIAPLLQSAAFDGNAGVRFMARAYAQKRSVSLPSREEALAAVSRGEKLVGALALLSDYGGARDAAAVRPFTEHGNKRVRIEARRTLTILLA